MRASSDSGLMPASFVGKTLVPACPGMGEGTIRFLVIGFGSGVLRVVSENRRKSEVSWADVKTMIADGTLIVEDN